MNALMKRFLIRSTLLAIVFFLIGWIIYSQAVPQYQLDIFPFILIFFFLTTNLVHAYLLRIAGKDIAKFSTRYMATSMLKMLFYLLVAVAYMMIGQEQLKLFLINYLIMYAGFTILEVAEISRVVKMKN